MELADGRRDDDLPIGRQRDRLLMSDHRAARRDHATRAAEQRKLACTASLAIGGLAAYENVILDRRRVATLTLNR
jgi:hypothetical protein